MASKSSKNYSTTEEDLYRNQDFNASFYDGTKKYEYKAPENVINRNKHDPLYQEKLALMTAYHRARKRNNILNAILRKRALGPVDAARKVALLEKRRDETINETEDAELDRLCNIDFSSDNDKNAQEIYRGIDAVFYYLDARKKLLAGTTQLEWTGIATTSREQPLTDARCTTVVVNGNLIDEAVKQSEKGFNPVIVCWGSRLAPGGDWDKGRMGVEEELFYRTSASVAITDDVIAGFYPLQDTATLYLPKVFAYGAAYDKSSSERFAVDRSAKQSFVSMMFVTPQHLSADCKRPASDPPSDCKYLSHDQEEMLKIKLRNVIQTALYWGHNAIVMTPIGSGAPFNYPADDITSVYRYVMFSEKTEYYHKLKRVTVVFGAGNPDEDRYKKDLHGITHAT